MKIKSLIFLIAIVLTSCQAELKHHALPIEIDLKAPKLEEKNKKSEIQPFDFEKVFNEAEVYFKAAKSWKKIKCTAKTGFVCAKKECAKKEVNSFLILDRQKETIYRCEGKICDEIPAKFKQMGIFVNIQSEGPIGTLIRVLGDNRYKEIATVGLDAYIANGECVPN